MTMRKNKLFLISLGCDKNRVDSERMLGFLEDAGFSFTDDEYEADVILVNTCCFIDDAKTESIETILEMATGKPAVAIAKKSCAERHVSARLFLLTGS